MVERQGPRAGAVGTVLSFLLLSLGCPTDTPGWQDPDDDDGAECVDEDGDGWFIGDACEDGVDQDCDDTVAALNHDDNDGDGDSTCDGDCWDNDPDLNLDDEDGDGYSTCGGDCDDDDATLNVNDADGDGFSSCEEDCDDEDDTVYPGAPEACNGEDDDCDGEIPPVEEDFDGDGYSECEGDCDEGDAEMTPEDADGDGYSTCDLDCDDDDAAVHPGATEVCNGEDDDCDGVVPASELDGDGDGFAECEGDCDGTDPTLNLDDADGDGFSTCDGDCNDTHAWVHPDAVEICNQMDDDCSPATDEDLDGDGDGASACDGDCDDTDPAENILDQDGDGVDTCGGDCDDTNANLYPGNLEVCDGVDNDCDGDYDDDDLNFLGDEDGDGDVDALCGGTDCNDEDVLLHGLDTDGDGVSSCDADCDDLNPQVAPGFGELCDEEDNDCDGLVDTDDGDLVSDFDGDGHDADGCGLGGDDCDDGNALVYPGAYPECDGVFDNDCDGLDDGNEIDDDHDQVSICGDDCDDSNPDVYPNAPQLCDGVLDNDCDTFDDANEVDDWDLDGFTDCAGDCDDLDGNVNPDAPETCDGVDEDCDGTVDEDTECYDDDGDGMTELDGDCDDGEPLAYPGAPEPCDNVWDNNCDGADVTESDVDGDGHSGCYDDCNDLVATVYPGAPQLCDGILDNDCDGVDDSNELEDLDGDGYTGCEGDCDDASPSLNPGAIEICDGLDNDCDGDTDQDDSYFMDDWDGDGDGGLLCGGTDCDDTDATVDGLDRDGDGVTSCDGDCDDLNDRVMPGYGELCDGLDNDCDTLVDGADGDMLADFDGDGHLAMDCGLGGDDCDDAEAATYPGAPQDCDGIFDNDCDGVDDGNEIDDDADLFSICGDDCDDTNPDVYPGAPQLCDWVIDNDCDGIADENEFGDLDGDGYTVCDEDCDDLNSAVHPGATELCDGLDNDCDGFQGLNEADDDWDQWTECDGDCDDADAAAYPGAPELCDGIDNNCDGTVDEAVGQDLDGDGYSPCAGDCDDGDPAIHPAATEICDGLDNDCDGARDEEINTCAAPAATDPTGYFAGDGGLGQHVMYVDDVGHFHLLYYLWTDQVWNHFHVHGYAGGLLGLPTVAGQVHGWATAGGPMGDYLHYVYRDAAGEVWEVWYEPAAYDQYPFFGWGAHSLTQQTGAPPAASDPVGYYAETPYDQSEHVFYRDIYGDVQELEYVYGGGGWQNTNLSVEANASAVADGELDSWFTPYPAVGHCQHVAYRSTDAHIHELWDCMWEGEQTWTGWTDRDLTVDASTLDPQDPPDTPLAASDPSGFYTGSLDWEAEHMMYIDGDGDLVELYLQYWDMEWCWHNLSDEIGAPGASSRPAVWYTDADAADWEHVVYAEPQGDIREAFFMFQGVYWAHHDLTTMDPACPAAVGNPDGYYTDVPAGETEHVMYRDAGGDIWEMYYHHDVGGLWSCQNLTAMVN